MNPELLNKVLEPIKSLMESGELPPWAKSWDTSIGSPINAVTGKGYSGANRLLLMIAALRHGDSRFLGFEQAHRVSGTVRKASRSIPILLPIFRKTQDSGGNEKEKERLAGFRLGRVFSIKDCTGLDPKKIVALPEPKIGQNPIQATMDFVAIRNPKIVEGPNPCYIPALDEIRMPDVGLFKTPEAHSSTLLHEILHWTGANGRMNRKGVVEISRFGRGNGEEELIAEIGSAYLRHSLGFSTAPEIADSASYIASWLRVLKETPQILLTAASEAERAIRWYRGEVPSRSEVPTEDLEQQQAA